MSYEYKNLEYDPKWYGEVYDDFFSQDLTKKNHSNDTKHIVTNYSKLTSSHTRTKMNPLVISSGSGPFLIDVDNNIYLDFGSGIYVTNLGHAHPKVSQAVSIEAKKLMNCHDYITPVKSAYLEKLSNSLGGKFDNIHLYDNGSTPNDFAIKAARAITGKYEILSCFADHHGKTLGAGSLGRISSNDSVARLPGFYMVPRPNKYRPIWTKGNGEIDTDAYINFYDLYIKESTTGQIAAFILEPIQGWGGTIIPPSDFFPKLRKFCDERGILLIIDEVLTGFGRTGEWLCVDHWEVTPDILILGKGIGNGFPMGAMLSTSNFAEAIANIGPSSTFGGNPMACAAGLATIEVFDDDEIISSSSTSGDRLLNGLKVLKKKYSFIGDVRGIGCLLAIEFVKDHSKKTPYNEVTELFYQECLKRNLIPGIPVINLVRIAPPLIADDILIDHALKVMDESLSVVEKNI
jgi:4-aminobutyrate aminotransferase-like enzyme